MDFGIALVEVGQIDLAADIGTGTLIVEFVTGHSAFPERIGVSDFAHRVDRLRPLLYRLQLFPGERFVRGDGESIAGTVTESCHG
jgi:hypothetical protein